MFEINTCFDEQTVLLEYLQNDYKCAFVVDDVSYFSVDQYLLYQYALIMGDEKACQEILETKTPKKLSKIDVKTKEERWYLWAVQRQEEKKEEDPFQKALSIMCPLSRFKGKTLGEVLREEPEVLTYLAVKGADKYKETHPQVVKAAKILCEYAKKKSKRAEEDAA